MGGIVCPHDCIFDQVGVAAGGDFDPGSVVGRHLGCGAGPAWLGSSDASADRHDREQCCACLGDFRVEDALGRVGLWLRDLFAFFAGASRLAGRTGVAPRGGKIARCGQLVAVERGQLLLSLPGADGRGKDSLCRGAGRNGLTRRGRCGGSRRLGFGCAVGGGRSEDRDELRLRVVAVGSGCADGYAVVARLHLRRATPACANQCGTTAGVRGTPCVQEQRRRCVRPGRDDASARHGRPRLVGRSGELVSQHRRIDERAQYAGAAPGFVDRACRSGRMVRGVVDQRACRRQRWAGDARLRYRAAGRRCLSGRHRRVRSALWRARRLYEPDMVGGPDRHEAIGASGRGRNPVHALRCRLQRRRRSRQKACIGRRVPPRLPGGATRRTAITRARPVSAMCSTANWRTSGWANR